MANSKVPEINMVVTPRKNNQLIPKCRAEDAKLNMMLKMIEFMASEGENSESRDDNGVRGFALSTLFSMNWPTLSVITSETTLLTSLFGKREVSKDRILGFVLSLVIDVATQALAVLVPSFKSNGDKNLNGSFNTPNALKCISAEKQTLLRIKQSLHSQSVSLRDKIADTERLTKENLELTGNLANLFIKYKNYEKEILEQYKVPFEILVNDMKIRLALVKVEALTFKNKHDELERLESVFNSQDAVMARKTERRQKERHLTQIKEYNSGLRSRLTPYDNLDQGLLRNFVKLKNELESHEWACAQLRNTSSDSPIEYNDRLI